MDKKKNYTNFLNLCYKIQNQYYKSVIEQDIHKKQLDKEFFRFTKEMDLAFKNWLTKIPKKKRERYISNYETKVNIELNTNRINRNTFEIKKSKWILKQISFWKDYHHSIKCISNQDLENSHKKNYFTFIGDEKQLKMIFDFLCETEYRNKNYCFIKNTSYKTFKDVIIGNSEIKKINWNAYINSLKYFIEKMYSKNLLEGSNLWILTANAFLVKNKSFTNKNISNKTSPSTSITNVIDSFFIRVDRVQNI